MIRLQITDYRLQIKIFVLFSVLCSLFSVCCAQEGDLEFTLDVTSNTISLPKIFKPNIDLSGRGFHHQSSWPQELAAAEVLDIWQKEIGFEGMYRLQYNLWEIQEFAKDKASQEALLANYEAIIKKISDAGGVVILDIFGSPAGLGRVLDKKSAILNLKAFKELIKSYIRNLSCQKRYNIWYEVWTAPDLENFFLGREQEYFNLYRQVALAIKELEQETKIHIPLGGPAISVWFQNLDGNTIISPERSLIYRLIRFCYQKHLPLDFITWHNYCTDPKTEKEITIYNKPVVKLVRDWLAYFHFERNTPLIIDEWNFDRNANVLPERSEKSYVCASFIPARIKNMYEAGLDYQLYFALEDFHNNKEGVVRNLGIFSFEPKEPTYKGSPKSIYNIFRMLKNLGNKMFALPKFNDEFTGAIATKTQDGLAILFYNYLDPEIFQNYLSRNISTLNSSERLTLLNLIKSDKIEKIKQHQLDITLLRLSKKVKSLLVKAQELNDQVNKFMTLSRNIKIGIKNLKENYLYQRYIIDSSCSLDCKFAPIEEKEISALDSYQETLNLNPYSVQMIILKKKPPEPKPAQVPEVTATQNITNSTN